MRERNYIIGFENDGRAIYGNDGFNWICSFTLAQAKQKIKEIPRKDVKIYKFIEVK